MSGDALAEQLGMVPHPFVGWYREAPLAAPDGRCLHHLLMAGQFAPWHQMNVPLTYGFVEGSPVTLSLSADGVSARGGRLAAPSDRHRIAAGTYRAFEPLGRHAILSVTGPTDHDPFDWSFCPEDWFPGAGGP